VRTGFEKDWGVAEGLTTASTIYLIHRKGTFD